MSSMLRGCLNSLAMIGVIGLAPAGAAMGDDAAAWDKARIEAASVRSSEMARAIERWKMLTKNDRLSFEAYSGFVLAYPGFPRERTLRIRAENALENEAPTSKALVHFFDSHQPVTNKGRVRYALALQALNRPEAFAMARKAWRMGRMSGAAEAYILGLFGGRLSTEDHIARMEALLWQGDADAAVRLSLSVPEPVRALAKERLALIRNDLPSGEGIAIARSALHDPGVVYNLVRFYRKNRRISSAIDVLASRPQFTSLPFRAGDLVKEMLIAARKASPAKAARIAASVDDLFAPGTDISKSAFRLRDDYTSLVWLGGTKALWRLHDGTAAAALFYRYGAAARTPQTRSKGFYWAALASRQAGNSADASRYFEMAAQYPDRFYGMLALEKLGRPIPDLSQQAVGEITPAERAAFDADPLTRAVREVAVDADWRTAIQFYRAICERATTLSDHLLIADLARAIGRRDLAVILAGDAEQHNFSGFTALGHPKLQLPPGANWTMVHAIARQESQFAGNAISHAGARGLMQLMPATAREQAGKLGMTYMSANLINSPSYNIRLGDAYFARMMDYYGGSYPLAIAAYNAGPGNVNKWLRANGDPRTGAVEWISWIERIPIYETKNYVQRVIENAAVYEQLYPSQLRFGGARSVSAFLR